ncbi:dUTP diphosphatase [Bacillus shivajii]|uniref:dUTP diphosphatase n=1 Tax=Bacillus shivajii TaxID=1983719 RepID=UPI001CF9DD7F|nr:dUTP diphosphatase [Bacillus shivajii]UCZ52214.1 dUTP diphosphatase [Bacillus shivajii]
MNFTELYKKQKELDTYIEEKHRLQTESLLDRKLMALHVEISELANETRCFKFWSEKGPSPQTTILEEYVDGIHFILSVGLEYGYEDQPLIPFSEEGKKEGQSLVPYFYAVIESIGTLRKEGDRKSFEQLFHTYLSLGSVLGFTEQDIISAYEEKNEINHERQDSGY